MIIRKYKEEDLLQMIEIWNEVVEEGNAFPQEFPLDLNSAREFFALQTYTGVAEDNGSIFGLYILHPNNVGRCNHIANASYCVKSTSRGLKIGHMLVKDCLVKAKENNFKILQFNAVVENNYSARHLYEKLGFIQLGVIKNGFRLKDGNFVNICPYYVEI